MAEQIPFNRPWITGKEMEYLTDAVSSVRIGSDGPYTQKCAQLLQERLGIQRILMTPSCTAALEMAVMLCDLGPGDEVIVPSYTFVSTALALELRSSMNFSANSGGSYLELCGAFLDDLFLIENGDRVLLIKKYRSKRHHRPRDRAPLNHVKSRYPKHCHLIKQKRFSKISRFL